MHMQHRAPILLALTALLMAVMIGGAGTMAAQPPAPDDAGGTTPSVVPTPPDLPPEAQAALADFIRDAAQGNALVQGMPAPISDQVIPRSQVFLPLVAHSTLSPSPTPVPPADISVTIRPDPSIRVARSSQLSYEIRVRNYGEGSAGSVVVDLPITSSQIDLINFAATPGDFVSADEPERVEVTFGGFAPDERRDATLLFSVSDALLDDAVIDVRASFRWDGPQGGAGQSNRAPVLVGGFNNDARYVFLAITPTNGPPGTRFEAFTDRFIPDEPLTAWLNTPDGIEPIERTLHADAFGRIRIDLDSVGRAPTTYELVIYGQRSKLVAVSEFTVD
ncbi:hypothetical protein EKD04_025830 [Chloroflexales bacterium ZM16-3]|nr:hypothetical protein [Chloroflexales bacterium ZM16-3]